MFLRKHFLGATDDEDADIQRNLEMALSTKRGCGYFREDFGLSDVAFRTAEEVVQVLTREIKENIASFEPRVKVVRIKEVYDDDGVKVRLEVVLAKHADGKTLNLDVDLRKRSARFSRA